MEQNDHFNILSYFWVIYEDKAVWAFFLNNYCCPTIQPPPTQTFLLLENDSEARSM